MMKIQTDLQAVDLLPAIARLWEASAPKIRSLEDSWRSDSSAPVFTIQGRYAARSPTHWTEGFRFGSALLQFDATDERAFLDIGRQATWTRMPWHLTQFGAHDHAFNNVSTYGNLWRLAQEGRVDDRLGVIRQTQLALAVSGAVQAARWTRTSDGSGFVYSFSGPHSLFIDSLRSMRSLALAHQFGHVLTIEHDEPVSLLMRLAHHVETTARYAVYYGDGRDAYDVRGRVAQEVIFDTTDGRYRCPSTQQGWSPFTTWMRGLAWAMCGFAELLEWLATRTDGEFSDEAGGRRELAGSMCRAAEATCDFYIDSTPTDGVPYWDSGAPGLARLGQYLDRPSDPYSAEEPIDSSAAAIAAQGLLRLGHYITGLGDNAGQRYWEAGLTVARTLLNDPYLSVEPSHQGLLLHSVYHRPDGWDYVPRGRRVPCGESSMWGDYHLRELALYIGRIARGQPYLAFYGPAQISDPYGDLGNE